MFKKKNSIEQQQVKAVNPMIILIVFLLIAAIATYIIPAGSFCSATRFLRNSDRIIEKK